MALIQNIGSYVDAVTGRYGGFGDKGAINADSEQRNFIGSEMQWMKDNGLELGDPDAQKNFDSFMALVNSKSNSNSEFSLGNGFLGWGGANKMGSDELTAMAKMMQQLQEMQASGKITMDEYAEHMTKLFSTEMIDDLEHNGDGPFKTLAQNVYDLDDDREPDPAVQAENEARMAVDRRPVINDIGDYRDSVMSRRGDDVPTYETVDDAKNALYDTIRAAQKTDPPQITQEQFDAVHDYISNTMSGYSDPNTGMYSNNTALVVYAVQDALATGNQDIIDKFMDPDTLKGLQNGSLDGLSDLDFAARGGSFETEGPGKVVRDVIGDTGKIAGDAAARTGLGVRVMQMNSMGLFEKDESTGTYPGVDMIADTLVCNYFDPQPDADGNVTAPPITADEYFERLDMFENLSDKGKELYLEEQPEFASAHAAMQQIDQISETMIDALDAGSSELDVANAMVDAITGESVISAGDVLGAGSQVAGGQARDLSEIMPVTDAGTLDYDAEMTAEDIAILQQKDPMSRYKDLQEAAVTVWRGGVYGSGDTRRERLAEAGFSPEEIDRIQDMVNYGPKFCQSMTPEKYDELYAEQDGGTLAERTSEFNARQLEAADKMLTYEGGGDFMAAHNGQDGVEPMTREQANELYADAADAARRLIDDETDGPGLEQEGAADNLASYVASGEAAFENDERNAGRGEEYQIQPEESVKPENGEDYGPCELM